ncbi:hypothetical protein BC830DRAFT_56714 [Chytriomyces sp. MP71]|nr:hypothetical protein BC830DRAFT_56714 [Chytriomyces sp. MP71]
MGASSLSRWILCAIVYVFHPCGESRWVDRQTVMRVPELLWAVRSACSLRVEMILEGNPDGLLSVLTDRLSALESLARSLSADVALLRRPPNVDSDPVSDPVSSQPGPGPRTLLAPRPPPPQPPPSQTSATNPAARQVTLTGQHPLFLECALCSQESTFASLHERDNHETHAHKLLFKCVDCPDGGRVLLSRQSQLIHLIQSHAFKLGPGFSACPRCEWVDTRLGLTTHPCVSSKRCRDDDDAIPQPQPTTAKPKLHLLLNPNKICPYIYCGGCTREHVCAICRCATATHARLDQCPYAAKDWRDICIHWNLSACPDTANRCSKKHCCLVCLDMCHVGYKCPHPAARERVQNLI